MNTRINFKTNLRSGASLLEMLIVLLIFIVLATLGYQVLMDFKNGTEIRGAVLQFSNTVDTVRNLARNNVATRNPNKARNPNTMNSTVNPGTTGYNEYNDPFVNQWIGYLIYFTGNADGTGLNSNSNFKYRVFSCSIPSSATPGTYVCDSEETTFASAIDNIIIESEKSGSSTSTIQTSNACDGILFKSLSGEMRILRINPSGNIMTTLANLTDSDFSGLSPICQVRISHSKDNNNRESYMQFDATTNTFKQISKPN